MAHQIILRPAQVAKMLGISLPTLWRWDRDDNTFPPKIRLGPNMVGYLAADIETWLAARIKDGDPGRIRGCVARALGHEGQDTGDNRPEA